MPLIRQPVPNLIGGVSQQAPAVRSPDQCEEQINCWPSPVDGLTKRQPTQHVAKLTTGLTGGSRYHFVNRSPTEQYLMQFSTSVPRIHTLAAIGTKAIGDQLTINDPQATGYVYLSNTLGKTARETLRVFTVADYTFILNNTKVVAMDTATSAAPVSNTEAYVFVRQGNYKTNYTVTFTISGVTQSVTCKTWAGNQPNGINGSSNIPSATNTELNSIKTDDIAEELRLRLLATGTFTTTQLQRVGSVVRVRHSILATQFEPTDSIGDSTLAVIWKTVPRVTNYLPEICTDGFIVKVVGDAEIIQDNYYVKFKADAGTAAFGKGTWQEDLGYSQEYTFLKSTMPHVLIRTFNGSGDPVFAWQPADWLPKLVGDTVVNPRPSFVGKLLQNLFFYKERLGLLADDRVILTETREPFNFWRTTNLVLEDTAPIDVTNNFTPVALSKSATPYNENVILKSARSQFILRGNEILSPRTVQITPVSQFESYENLDPINAGRSLFFGFKRGDHSGIREFFQTSDGGNNSTFDSADVTLQIPNYISGEIEWMAVSTLEETLVAKASDSNTLYIYKYIWGGNQKILSSWSKWEIASDTAIRHFSFIENTLYLALEYPDSLYIEKVDIATGLIDASQTYLTLIDRRIDQAKVTGQTYNSITNTTTFTLPYTINILQTPMVVQKITGVQYQVVSYTTTTVTVRGNLTGINFWTGIQYTADYTFTKPIMKQPLGRGVAPVSEAKQDAKNLWLEYHNSGVFQVIVKIGNGSTYTYEVAGPAADFGDVDSDAVTLKTGTVDIPIYGPCREVVCRIVNSGPYPSNISSAVWDLQVYSASRSVQ